MPELPEVETVRRGLAPVMTGARIIGVNLSQKNLRFPLPEGFEKRLIGRRIDALSRRAKYLLADLDNGDVLVMHLGMSGSFRIAQSDIPVGEDLFRHDRSKDEKHDHVTIRLSDGQSVIYNDPRRFGFMDLISRANIAQHRMFRNIGIEPLGNQLDGEFLASVFQNKMTPLKSALLDQSLIAGLGNIYVCEALFRSRLSPRRKAGSIVYKNGKPTDRAERLASVIRIVLEEAISAGGSTLRDHQLTDGSLGYFQHTFRVYDREGQVCPTTSCGQVIKRIVQSGRSTFFCSNCQK